MAISLSHCFICVLDQDEALAFYRDGVGLEVINDVVLDEMRWVTLSSPTQPGVEIVLLKPGPPFPPEDQATVRELLSKGVMPGVIFATTDCDAIFEKLRASGAEVLQEPMDQHYGVRDCAFRDPSGNMIRFSQPNKP
jgi:predicted enzyme related to lactoylglutathione lyase